MTETPTPLDDEAPEAAGPEAPAGRAGTPPPIGSDAAAAPNETAPAVLTEDAPTVPAATAEGAPAEVGPAEPAEAVSTAPVARAPTVPVDLSPAACAARLAELFPALFGAGRALPIKLRIQNDIQQRAPGVFTRKSLSPFLHRYTTGTAYLKALVNSPHRFDLDGAPAGDIDDVHRQAAATELERRRGLFEAKRAAERAAANEARRAAEAAARQQHAAEDQARRDRAALLRAFESSTLTRANFCALKGIVEAELDGQLHQAWLEREQRAQEVRPAGDAPARGEGRPPLRSGPGPRRENRSGGPSGDRPAGATGLPAEGPRTDSRPQRPRGTPGPRPAAKPAR